MAEPLTGKEPCNCGVAYHEVHLPACPWFNKTGQRTENARLRKKLKNQSPRLHQKLARQKLTIRWHERRIEALQEEVDVERLIGKVAVAVLATKKADNAKLREALKWARSIIQSWHNLKGSLSWDEYQQTPAIQHIDEVLKEHDDDC